MDVLNVILVVAVRSGWILISVDAGLSDFERFWTLLNVILGRSGPLGLDTYLSRHGSDWFLAVLDAFGCHFGRITAEPK